MASGIQRIVLAHDATMTLVRVVFEAGAVGRTHHHAQTQASYVVSGHWDVVVDGLAMSLGPGDTFFAGSNVEHSATTADGGELITTFAPGRAELLG